jgi:hypothetical protein
VGFSWYTWLEQGRPINASKQVLDAIARTLKLDRAERLHLFHLAGISPGDGNEPDDPSLASEVQAILDALPTLPAALYNARCDIVLHNAAFAAMFPDLLNDPTARRNTLWSLSAAPGSCDQLTDRDAELARMVAMLRADYGRHVGAPTWEQFLGELRSASPEFAARRDAAVPPGAQEIGRLISQPDALDLTKGNPEPGAPAPPLTTTPFRAAGRPMVPAGPGGSSGLRPG